MVGAGIARNARPMRREDRHALREIRAAIDATGEPLRMTDRQITYVVVGAAAVISLIAWLVLVAVPAWTSYWRLREKVLALVMSVYVLAAFVLAGALAGGLVLWYYDRI